MNVLFDKVDDAIYDLADNASSNQRYTIYFDALRIVRKQRRTIHLNFLRLLREWADSTASGILECDFHTDITPDSQSYVLVQEAELEESLAINNLVSRAESRYRQELLEMNRHLARLLDRDQWDARANPFGPFAICNAFREALTATHQLEPPIRLAIYKLFDKHVTDRLGDYYSRCVALALGGEGAPEQRLQSPSRPGSSAAVTPPRSTESAPGPVSQEGLTLPFETLQTLLGRQRPPEVHTQTNLVKIQTNELFVLLNSLGAQVRAAGSLEPKALRGGVERALADQDGARHALERSDEDTLDAVFMFFEHLLQGNDLPDAIKSLIGRMQIPVVKLALIDKSFFSEQGHPARQLLNHIGEAAVGWSEKDGRGPDSLYGMIERVVDQLISDFDGAPELFARMDQFFVAKIAREQAQARDSEAKILAELAAPTLDPERQLVADALSVSLAKYAQVPAVVESILHEGWEPSMRLAYRTGGTTGQAWKSGMEMVDQLLWSVQPKRDSEERRQLLRRIPGILSAMRAQLSGAGCNQRQLARWLKDLQTVHLGVIQGARAGAGSSVLANEGAAGQSAVSPELGTWIELHREAGGSVRFKLAWISRDGENYVLVDRLGRRGPALSRQALSSLLEQGRASLLGAHPEPIADRALRSMVTQLAS